MKIFKQVIIINLKYKNIFWVKSFKIICVF